MHLMEIDGDIYVASEVVSVTRNEKTVTVTCKTDPDGFEYEFDSAEKSQKIVLDCCNQLLAIP